MAKLPSNRRDLLKLVAASLAASSTDLVLAQPAEFPNRPIVLYVPFSAGGTTDALMRVLAESASKTLGQRVVLDYKPGAAASLGAAALLHAQGNGYTLSLVTDSVLRLPHLQKTPFDPLKDFTYIIHLTGYMYGVAIRADAKWKTWAEMIADAKRNPRVITYGTTGVNGTPNLTMEEIAQKEGVQLTHVPFKGESEIVNALMGGHVDMGCVSGGVGSFIEAGKARWLTLWTPQRSKKWPDVPTLRDLGLDMVVTGPFGIAGPKGVDPKIVKQLHDAFKIALDDPATVKTLERLDQESAYLDSASYDRYVRQRYESQGQLIDRLGLRFKP